jgi:hypothetical protein
VYQAAQPKFELVGGDLGELKAAIEESVSSNAAATNGYRASPFSIFRIHEGPLAMSLPLGLFAMGSVFVYRVLRPRCIS